MVQIAGFQQQNAAERFLGLHKRTVGEDDLAILHSQRGRLAGRVEGFAAQEMPAAPKFIVVGKALFHHSLSVCWRIRSKLRLIDEP